MSLDLETRLRSLGEHLDTERAALGDGTEVATVVPFGPRRGSRILWAAAAAVVLVLGLVTVLATRDHATQPVDTAPTTATPTVPPTVSPTTDGPQPTDATETSVGQASTPPSSQPGDLTLDVSFRFDDASPDRQQVVDRIGARGQALGLTVQVSDVDPTDDRLQIVVRDVRPDDAVDVERAFLDLGETIWFRPVTKGCVVSSDGQLEVPQADPSTEQLVPLVGTGGIPGQWCTVGPAQADGSILTNASTSTLDPSTIVITADLLPGADGEAKWNALAAECFDRRAACPTGQIALQWGRLLYTATTVQTAEFSGSLPLAGTWSDVQAKALTDQISRGPAPFTLTPTN